MAPAYLEDQIERSRANLALETIDLYYLHNIESQRTALPTKAFRERLAKAVGALEGAVSSGRIGAWGIATWDGDFTFRRTEYDVQDAIEAARALPGPMGEVIAYRYEHAADPEG